MNRTSLTLAVGTDAIELNGVFTPDMREFFFARGRGGEPTIFHSRLTDNGWSAPRTDALGAWCSVLTPQHEAPALSTQHSAPSTRSYLNVDFVIRT